MTLIFYGNEGDNSGGGSGGGSTSVSFTYPYSAVWIYKRSLIDAYNDSGEITDELLKAHFICILGQASGFNVVDENSLTCNYNGKTLELYEDTDGNSETAEKTIGTYNNDDVIAISLTNMIYAGGDVVSGIWYFGDFKEYIMGIQPEPENPIL